MSLLLIPTLGVASTLDTSTSSSRFYDSHLRVRYSASPIDALCNYLLVQRHVETDDHYIIAVIIDTRIFRKHTLEISTITKLHGCTKAETGSHDRNDYSKAEEQPRGSKARVSNLKQLLNTTWEKKQFGLDSYQY